ncbi:hypothetical protein [Photobacterium sp. TLY01]|uniref:helix-turn-helix transcriptional regulator n=1 Tax=Photobacterium sp. TLY01 TaxID=2907534 RepID=UPI001F3F175E|nr:hypothetical protein [Photobacterium sp. TLY01]UIP28914.1 hypothetical protein LN341_05380 [Photobacterium sp. TLY01]
MQTFEENSSFLHQLADHYITANHIILLYDKFGKQMGRAAKFQNCVGVDSLADVQEELWKNHPRLANSYEQQVELILSTARPIVTIDYIRSRDSVGSIIKFYKRPIKSRSQIVGVEFCGFQVLAADLFVTQLLNLPTRNPSRHDIKISEIDAQILLLIKHGYNAKFAGEVVNISHKAVNKRLERLMVMLELSSRIELIEVLRSEEMLRIIIDKLVTVSHSKLLSSL